MESNKIKKSKQNNFLKISKTLIFNVQTNFFLIERVKSERSCLFYPYDKEFIVMSIFLIYHSHIFWDAFKEGWKRSLFQSHAKTQSSFIEDITLQITRTKFLPAWVQCSFRKINKIRKSDRSKIHINHRPSHGLITRHQVASGRTRSFN